MKAFVTGGGGFLGRYLIAQLELKNDTVVSFSRSRHDCLAESVQQIQGDLTDVDSLTEAMSGCDIVFHVAAKAGVWGDYQDYYDTNVVGTENILIACQRNRIQYLVYTSTPSVIYASGGVEGVDESVDYPQKFKSSYAQTKAIAEKNILQHNGENLKTLALRPHLIWGPQDHHFLPRLKAQSRAGKLRLIGSGDYKVDHIYIENAAQAHVCAADAMMGARSDEVCGRAYFLSQNTPWPVKNLINSLLQAIDEPAVSRFVPVPIAKIAGAIIETVYRTLRIKAEPPLSRFLVDQLSTPHWFNCDASGELLGYKPKISSEEGLLRLKKWYEQQTSEDTSGI